jgi:hypothetical protein
VTSVSDVYDKLSEASDRIHELHMDLGTTNDLLGQILDMSKRTVDTLVTGFSELDKRVDTTNAILERVSIQTETVICNVAHVNQQTCESLNELHWQTALSRDELTVLEGQLSVAEAAYPAAGLAYEREREVAIKLAECCPLPEPEPICSYEACADPGPYTSRNDDRPR